MLYSFIDGILQHWQIERIDLLRFELSFTVFRKEIPNYLFLFVSPSIIRIILSFKRFYSFKIWSIYMYKGFHSNSGKRTGFSRVNRGYSQNRRIVSFDPTNLINSPQEKYFEKKIEIKHTFADFDISESLKKNITEHGYTAPTAIQDRAIPTIISGHDLIGLANTGTGKTAAFLIPLIDNVIKNRNHKVLIITPTRELAEQIRDEFYKFSKGLQIYSALCIGGENIYKQKNDIKRNPNFVIGTPGRLKDLVKTKSLDLTHFNSIVLDEADRMVDIGFINEIKYFISILPKNRLSLFFTATLNEKVKSVLNDFVRNPVTVSVKTSEFLGNIEQKIIKVNNPFNKVEVLHNLLRTDGVDKVLIFGRTKHGVQKLSDDLYDKGFKSGAIHGNKRQSQRTKVLNNFKRNNINILVATDVAARGLDIPNVTHVINYDLPESKEAYTHRIGRTGRAGKKGFAFTFVS